MAAVLWPVAVLHYAYEILQASGERSIDLFSIWTSARAFLEHKAPYYALPGPPLPYPPSSLIVLAPLGAMPFTGAKIAMAFLSGAAAALAGALLLEMFGVRWRSVAGAVMLLGITLFGPMLSTFLTGNVNALILAGEAAFLFTAARGRWMLAAVILGVSFALKPVLLPLIVIPLLWKRFREAILALAIPAVLTAIAYAAGERIDLFFTKVLPFLARGEGELKGGLEQFNMSLVHAGNAFGVPDAVTLLARIAVVVVAAVLIRARWKERLDGDDDALRMAEISALLLLPAFLSFSSSLSVYAIYLLPLFASVVHPQSVMRNAAAWVGVYCVGTFHKWNTDRLPGDARTFASLLPTWGYLILLGVIALSIRERASLPHATPRRERSFALQLRRRRPAP
jgi:arabinofuranan 3-O-arabinosyltransferase